MFLIGISGGTGSGKSTLAKELLKHYHKKNIAIINQDSYYKNFEKLNFQERCLINYDNPKSIDFKLLVDNLYNLKNDPYENNNLKDERKDVVLDMEKQIQDIIGDHKI